MADERRRLQGSFRWDNNSHRGELTYAFNDFMGLRSLAEDRPHHAWGTGSTTEQFSYRTAAFSPDGA